MAQVSIARRYAKALLEVAPSAKEADQLGEELESFARILTGHGELAQAVDHPAHSLSDKRAVLNRLLEVLQLSLAISNLLKLLLERRRLSLVPDIARIYRNLADARVGRVRGQVASAVELSTEVLSRLAATLEKATQKQVVLRSSVDPSLIGGVAAQVGSVMFDGSVKAQLEEMRRTLRG